MRISPVALATATALVLVASLALAADRRVEGTVKAVDAEKSSIVLTTKAGAAPKDEALDVVRKAKVTVNGKAATLKDVRRGQKAVVVVNAELEVATRVDATGEGVAPMVPEITVVNELPESDLHHTGPWVSADGLTLYWKTQPGAGGNAWIWSARRKTKDGLFEDGKRHVPGSDMTVSADGLEMILLQGDSLWVTTRPSLDAAFARPRKLAEFQGQGFLSVPCLSGNDLVLYADRFGPKQPVAPVKSVRADRRAKWSRPAPVKLALPAGKRVRFFSVTPDGSRAFSLMFDATPEQPGGPSRMNRNELVTMAAEGDGFGRPEVIKVGGEALRGTFPRYVAATNELFFVRQDEGKPAQIVLVRNFDPDAIETASAPARAVPSKSDREVLQGEWVTASEEMGGKRLTSDQLKQMNRRLSVRGNRLVMRRVGFGGKFGVYNGTFELGAASEPRTFDWSGTDPEGARLALRGIYTLEGDTFRVCWAREGPDTSRPGRFESPAGSRNLSLVFERERKSR